jgi:hypothetical protein
VDRYFKGNGPAQVVVTSPGGVLPERNLEMTVTGMAEYRTGEEVLMFVTGSTDRSLSVYGLGRGKLSVQRDAEGIRRVLGQPFEAFLNSVSVILENQGRKP